MHWASQNRSGVLDGWANIWRQAKAEGERVRGLDGGVRRVRAHARSYEYTLDSSQAAALTFRLLDRGASLRRDTARNVVSLAARRAPAGLDLLARGLGVDVTPSRRAPEGDPVPLRSLGLLAGAGISTTSGSYGEARYVIEQRWGRTVASVAAATSTPGPRRSEASAP